MSLTQRRHSVRAMGSLVEILAVGAPDSALDWAGHEVARLERCWSRFDPTSELCALNRAGGTGPVPASDELRMAVGRAVRLWRATDGLFDPTTLDALEAAGYDRTFEQVAAGHRRPSESLPTGPCVPTPDGVLVDDEAATVTLPVGVRLDLGGIGKGLAADLVARGLVERGAVGACVSVGGDVAVAGEPDAPCWLIPVEDPFEDGLVRWNVLLASGAIVQSSRLVRRWWFGGAERHHVIDPRTGHPAVSGLTGVVVVADEAWWAEGIAKAALIAGPVTGVALIERLARAGWLIRDDRSVTLAGAVRLGTAA